MGLERLIGPEEDHALLLEVLADVVVHDLGVVLAADAGEVLLLRLGDAQLVVRAPDVVGHVVPGLHGLVGPGDVVVDVLEVDRTRSAPHVGIGRASKWRYAFRRIFVIHSGSPLIRLISATISALIPFGNVVRGCSGSFQPYR